MPSVSVIIPAWRHPGQLAATIDSAIGQRDVSVEIVVVDDCSPHDIRAALPERDVPIRYHRQPENRGAPAARNVGVGLASHDIVAFLDDDDRFLPDKLRKQVPQLDKHAASLCGFRAMGSTELKVQNTAVITEDILRRGNFLCGCSGLVARRETMLAVPFDETLPRGQDWDIYIRLLERGTLGYVAEPLFEYLRQSPGGISMKSVSASDARLMENARVLFKHRAWLGERSFRRRLASYCLAYLHKRPDFLDAIGLSLRHAGVRATATVILEKALRVERKV